MANYFYIDANGQRQGPANEQALKELAEYGIITPDTQLETDTGRKGLAKQVPGLKFYTEHYNQTQQTQIVISEDKSEPLNRQTYIILALFGGWTGAHQFYANRKDDGKVNVILSFVLLIANLFTNECHRLMEYRIAAARSTGFEALAIKFENEAFTFMILYYLGAIVFMAVLIAQIVQIVKAITNTKTDGSGIPMKE